MNVQNRSGWQAGTFSIATTGRMNMQNSKRPPNKKPGERRERADGKPAQRCERQDEHAEIGSDDECEPRAAQSTNG
jgi:hypothetical protein